MLVFAKQYENEFKQTARDICLKEKYKWYNTGYVFIPEIEDSDWNNIRRLSYTNKLIGYFNASVDRTNNVISNLGIWSIASNFKEYKVFEYDLLLFIKSLLIYPSIQFTVITQNPVKKKYRKFIECIGGNFVGIKHKVNLIEGQLYDEELYEIIPNEEVKEKLQALIDRRKNA